MNKNLNFLIFFSLLFLCPKISFVRVSSPYLKAIQEMNAVPPGFVPVPACLLSEKDKWIQLAKQAALGPYILTPQGKISNAFHEEGELYKGNFSNQSFEEYALILTSPTMHTQTVTITRLQAGKLVEVDLDGLIIGSVLKNGDFSIDFYSYTADPFAVVKDGKTYMRFMDYPYRSYNINKLILCTYLWEGENIKLSGPNLFFGVKLKDSLHCI